METCSAIEAAKRMLQEAGAEFVEVSIPLTKDGGSCLLHDSDQRSVSNLARYDGVRFGYRADFSKNPPGIWRSSIVARGAKVSESK